MVVLYVSVVVLADAVGTKGVDGALGVARDWLPVIAVLVVYKYSRGVADSLGMPVQFGFLVDADEALFGGHVPTVWLQERLVAPTASWWEGLTAAVYLSHFFASFVVLGALHARSRPQWARYLKRFITLNAMGVATYILVPAAPPWMASEEGLIGEVQRTTVRGIDMLGIKSAASLIESGQETTNDVAALPSLHAGYAFLVSLFLLQLAGRGRRWARVALVAYPLAMCFTLVYSGEHYVFDVILGFVYAAVAHAVWNRVEAKRLAAGDRAPATSPG
jgi:hypothetical protein